MNIFEHCFLFSTKCEQDIDLVKALVNRLVPLSLANPDVSRRRTSKCKLSEIIIKNANPLVLHPRQSQGIKQIMSAFIVRRKVSEN